MAVERERFFPQGEDKGAFLPNSRCEECGADVREHEWVDLETNGIVFNCSISVLLKEF
jgi:uncharacterized OB-fold protein